MVLVALSSTPQRRAMFVQMIKSWLSKTMTSGVAEKIKKEDGQKEEHLSREITCLGKSFRNIEKARAIEQIY